ncbi:DUF3325 domain-containing protein [Pelagibius sp.]|uniref:DUF3325 domain-containing protein n=1 Tax=Pelagibius sp. TaxID=1931238 RepID=UPI003BB0E31A
MTSALLLIVLSMAAYLGFTLLALSQRRHWSAVAGTGAPCRMQVIVLRGVGGAMIALSLVLALTRDGPSFGSLLWATAISLAALAVAFTLAWRPTLLRPLARCVAR